MNVSKIQPQYDEVNLVAPNYGSKGDNVMVVGLLSFNGFLPHNFEISTILERKVFSTCLKASK